MKSRLSILAFTLLASVLLNGPALSQSEEDAGFNANLVPYVSVPFDGPEARAVWTDPGDDGSWFLHDDDTRKAYIAKFKNDLGEDVLVSQWTDRMACAPMDCPMRIFVAGTRIFNDLACAPQEGHTMTASRNSLFLCDLVIPLRATEQKD